MRNEMTASQPLIPPADLFALEVRAIAAQKRRGYRDVWRRPVPKAWRIEVSERVARKLAGVK